MSKQANPVPCRVRAVVWWCCVCRKGRAGLVLALILRRDGRVGVGQEAAQPEEFWQARLCQPQRPGARPYEVTHRPRDGDGMVKQQRQGLRRGRHPQPEAVCGPGDLAGGVGRGEGQGRLGEPVEGVVPDARVHRPGRPGPVGRCGGGNAASAWPAARGWRR